MADRNTQKMRIIKHLEDGKTITTAEAFSLFGITKLTTRISELRHDGYDIAGEMVIDTDRNGQRCRYNRYRLVKD